MITAEEMLQKQVRDELLKARIMKCIHKDLVQQSRKHKSTSTRDIHTRNKKHRESGKQMFHECQGVRFRKRCKHGSGEAISVAKLYSAPLIECNERRGKTSHERKLHRIAMEKQARITRHEAYKITW